MEFVYQFAFNHYDLREMVFVEKIERFYKAKSSAERDVREVAEIFLDKNLSKNLTHIRFLYREEHGFKFVDLFDLMGNTMRELLRRMTLDKCVFVELHTENEYITLAIENIPLQ